MKVKMTTTMAGPNGLWQPGTELEVDEKFAKELIAGGYASALTPIIEEPIIETAEGRAGGKAKKQVATEER